MVTGHYFSANTSTKLVEIFRVQNGSVESLGDWKYCEKLVKLLEDVEVVWHVTDKPNIYLSQVIQAEEKVEQFLF